jgi:hypothetical protein
MEAVVGMLALLLQAELLALGNTAFPNDYIVIVEKQGCLFFVLLFRANQPPFDNCPLVCKEATHPKVSKDMQKCKEEVRGNQNFPRVVRCHVC